MTSSRRSVWEFQYSVECHATRRFAWTYWTDISNWNDPPATFRLDGPFDVGSRLTTILPDQTWHSTIRNVDSEREASIEMQLPDAVMTSHWMFEELSQDRVRITQRLALTGTHAKLFAGQASRLEQTVPEGMSKLAVAIERAQGLQGAE